MFNGIIDINKLKHNPAAINKLYDYTGESVVAKDDFYIVFPERFINKGLAVMGATVKLLSCYAIIDKNMNYAIVMAPIYMYVVPSNVTSVLVEGNVNKVLEVSSGSVFIPNRNLLMSADFLYDIFDEFYNQGKVPWYLSYTMVSEIFAESRKYAGSGLGDDPLAIEIIVSAVARSDKDKSVGYREVIKGNDSAIRPQYVGLSNVFYSYDNTMSKLMGGYMQQGITTAIVNKETETTKVSEILRA